jgi:Polyketide cyclase / dehydrase and lipid transport
MSRVSAAVTLPASVHEAETCWYDTARWPAWVDGLDRVLDVSADWPAAGASVIWQSGPAGRGRVTERALTHEPLAGQTVVVRDDSITGQQSVSFMPVDDRVTVTLTLEYEITKRSILTPAVDRLFIRRAMTASLNATLSRFAAELSERHAAT